MLLPRGGKDGFKGFVFLWFLKTRKPRKVGFFVLWYFKYCFFCINYALKPYSYYFFIFDYSSQKTPVLRLKPVKSSSSPNRAWKVVIRLCLVALVCLSVSKIRLIEKL